MTVTEDYARILAEDSDIRDHMPFLKASAERWKDPVIIELGVRTGRSTAAFLAAVQHGGHLWSVDINKPDVPDYWRDLGCWSFLQEDDMSVEACVWLPRRADILFIDTSHEYGLTVGELLVHAPRVSAGGLILMHDTEYPEINCVRPGAHESDVGRALDWWAPRAGQKWHNMTGCYGLGVVRVV